MKPFNNFLEIDCFVLKGVMPFLDESHLREIDLADEVFVLNVGGCIGEFTAKAIVYAKQIETPTMNRKKG